MSGTLSDTVVWPRWRESKFERCKFGNVIWLVLSYFGMYSFVGSVRCAAVDQELWKILQWGSSDCGLRFHLVLMKDIYIVWGVMQLNRNFGIYGSDCDQSVIYSKFYLVLMKGSSFVWGMRQLTKNLGILNEIQSTQWYHLEKSTDVINLF